MLSILYQAVRGGELTRRRPSGSSNAGEGCGCGCPGDRALQNFARKTAGPLGWADTFDAEYVALTQPHAGALITLGRQLAHAVKDLVTVEPIEVLY